MKKELRTTIYEKYNGRCAYCGVEISPKEMQVDHIIAQYNFDHYVRNKWRMPVFLSHLTVTDVDHIDNLMPACRVCNKWKSAYDLETFRKEIEEQIDRLNKYSANFRLAKKYGLITERPTTIKFFFEGGDLK